MSSAVQSKKAAKASGGLDFNIIGSAVAKQFAYMAKAGQLYRTIVQGEGDDEARRGLTKQALWDTYLAAFPAGSNPLYKERTEHDCMCCKQFVRTLGSVVSITPDGAVETIWDVSVSEPAYQAVVDTLAALVKSWTIDNVFLHTEKVVGTEKTFQQIVWNEAEAEMSDGKVRAQEGVITWRHYHVNLPATCVSKKDYIGPRLSEMRATHDVFKRSLEELTLDSVDTVLELIAQNSLYRGEEHKSALEEFRRLKVAYAALFSYEHGCQNVYNQVKENFVWSNISSFAARIRNTAIGTLLIDLSGGMEMEQAVKSFEVKVAPMNYKRPTALVTKAMIERAQKTVEELGYTSALERRFATIDDLTVNNLLFVDRGGGLGAKYGKTRKVGGEAVFAALASNVAEKPRSFDKVEELSIEKFLADVLPKASSLELMLENRHAGNFVSLIAPVDPTAKGLFKWPNNFSWSYKGDVADSMRERVATAGGRVDGVLRFTHSWNHPEAGRNASLMDLHLFMPGASAHKDGCHDHYPSGQRVGWNRRNDPTSGGAQDVDYFKDAPEGYVPIENIALPSMTRLKDGVYTCKIHNWNLRVPTTSGFRAEIEFDGKVFQYDHPQPLKHKEWITLAELTLKDGKFTIDHKHSTEASSREVWALPTQTFRKVSAVMLSPNWWWGEFASRKATRGGGQTIQDTTVLERGGFGVGNKHYFFMLEGCRNEGKARGFYNEFLDSRLDAHRKVFEMVGAKMKTEESDKQLSGLGFSSTQRSSVLVRVSGKFNRVVKVVF